MTRTRYIILSISLLFVVALLVMHSINSRAQAQSAQLSSEETLGKAIFFDKNLSVNGNQACATCHDPAWGFTGPDPMVNAAGAVYPGSHAELFGNRKPPSAAYAGDSPNLHYDSEEEVWIGGMFWDGRATGDALGDPLAEQAQGPFLNPLEQALPDAVAVCEIISAGEYADLFIEVYGEGSLECGEGVDSTYVYVARAIAAFERSTEVTAFTSKYDYYLAGEAELTEQEAWGLELFEDEEKGACALCHPSAPGPDGEPPLFTDFTYDNLGVPANPDNPFYAMSDYNVEGASWVDAGLGGFLKSSGFSEAEYMAQWGKQKVPSLRNIAMKPGQDSVKAYAHNGVFKSLEDIVHFYNTRETEEWDPPEIAENINTEELGDLGLTAEEEAAIIAFMHTLTDGYQP